MDLTVSPTVPVRAEEVTALSKSEEAGKLDWKGMVPVCSWCKKIRNPQGEWLTLEVFLRKYLGMECTHTICPDCQDRYYRDLS